MKLKQKQNIIFLHGITGNRNAFKKEYEYLKDTYHCHWYEFPGYDKENLGKSVPFSLDILVDQLHNEYEKAGIQEAHLCTLSFGCLPALAFAHRYPEKVKSLTFSGGYCNVPSTLRDQTIQLLEQKHEYTHTEWISKFAALLNPNKKEIPEDTEMIFFQNAVMLHPDVFEQAIRIRIEFDSETILSSIKQPILWIMGEYDDLYKSTLYNLNTWVPHVKYKELKGAGHVANIHQPEQFMNEFEKLLQDETNLESRLEPALV